MRRLCAALFLGVLCAPVRADYLDDIGYRKLALELGAALPTGIGIGVTQVEASSAMAAPLDYLPDTTVGELSGKTFTPESGPGTVSGHATQVAQFLCGQASSVAPGITSIHNYDANGWLYSDFLNYGTLSAPQPELQKVLNASFVSTSASAGNVEVLRRFDYAIQQSGFLGVVALNNGSQGNVPPLLGSCYNGLTVGLTNGAHSYGTNTTDGAGRTKPEIVAPYGATSFATPIVAATAAMLNQGAPANATMPVTMKAILMAGATKSQFPGWSRSATHPLDAIYGAGQVNVFNSQHILAAGPQSASTSATVARQGWDFTTTNSGRQLYFFDIPAGGTSSLSVVLTWNRTIADTIGGSSWDNPSSVLANLTLKLYTATGFTTGALVDASTSAVDNVEHIWRPALSPGSYAFEVTADTAGVSYGLAWISVPTVSIAATIPAAAEIGAVPGQFTIMRGGSTSAALTVSYTITGTATNGTDYTAIPASVTIPAGASAATITITPIADSLAEGNETVVLTLAGDPLYTFGTPASATVTIQDRPFDAWRFAKFTAAERADSSLSGDLADFEKDGVVNLHEYAFSLEPKTADPAGLPVVSIEAGGTLAIAYTRVKGATDISYLAEVTNDLVTWKSGPAFTAALGTTDHGATETVKVSSLLAPASPARQFMRVRITRP